MKKSYAIVGSWDFSFSPKGISTYTYDPDSGKLSHIDTIMETVCATQVSLDEERQIAYFVDSKEDEDNKTGGGGYVLALQLDPERGTLDLINRRRTLGVIPEYLCLDKRKRFLVVAHHASHHYITRIRPSEDGGFRSEVCYDDAALVLFELNEDGSIGEIRDISIPAGFVGQRDKNSHLHFVMHNPNGDFFVVCDKGLDRLYTYRLDPDAGKLIFLQEIPDEEHSFPRYALFHPRLPLLYVNHERNVKLDTYLYNTDTGKMVKLATTSLLFDWLMKTKNPSNEAADLVVHPGGKYMYASVRGVDVVAVLEIDPYGGLVLKQNIDCGGEGPRGLCVSPDGRYLFVLNRDSQSIATFAIAEDGRLQGTPYSVHANMSASMKILVLDSEKKEK